MTNLRKLILHTNKLTIVPQEISNLINLRLLSLGNNNLIKISHEINKLTNLRYLYLDKDQEKLAVAINFNTHISILKY